MIVVSNRVKIPESRAETFVARLRDSHGIEEQPGFVKLRVLEPINADGYVTMTVWETREDYENWKNSKQFERAHEDRSADEAFAAPNEVEIHEIAVERPSE